MYETIEDFRAHIPSFTIIEMLKDVTLKQRGTACNLTAGSEILCINSMANDALKNGVARKSSRLLKNEYRIYSGNDLTGKTLLVWRTGGIGDLFFLRPILVYLKRKYPTSTIILGTRHAYHDMVKLWTDAIDELSAMPLEMESTMDLADYHLSFEGLIEKCKDAETMDVHDLFAMHAGLDPNDIEWCVKMPLPPAKCNSTPRGDYVVVQYRASATVRTPYMGSIVAAINAVTSSGYKAVICDRKEYARDIDDIVSCCESPEMVENFAYTNTGLVDAIQLISKAKLVIAPDSSQMHIAAMQGVPSIGIYGPFPGALRCSRYPLAKWIEPPISEVCEHGGKCCFLHQYGNCTGNFKCWNNLNNDNLAKLVKEALDV